MTVKGRGMLNKDLIKKEVTHRKAGIGPNASRM